MIDWGDAHMRAALGFARFGAGTGHVAMSDPNPGS
jgi:hypothetical protein